MPLYDLIWDQLTPGWIEYSNLVYILGILLRKKKKEKVLKFLLLFEKGSHNLLILKRSIKFSCHLSNRFSSVVNCCNHQIVFFFISLKLMKCHFFQIFFFFCNFFLQLMCWGRKIQEESAFQRKKDMPIIMKILKKLGNKGIDHYKRHVWKMTENLIIRFEISNSLDPHLSKKKKEKKKYQNRF